MPVPDHFTGAPLRGPSSRTRQDPVTSVAVRGESVTAQPIPRRPADGEVLVSARTRDWAYIRHADSGREELYDRRADPSEQVDRLGTSRATAAGVPLERLRGATDERLARIETDVDARDSKTPEGVTDQLAALGYR